MIFVSGDIKFLRYGHGRAVRPSDFALHCHPLGTRNGREDDQPGDAGNEVSYDQPPLMCWVHQPLFDNAVCIQVNIATADGSPIILAASAMTCSISSVVIPSA